MPFLTGLVGQVWAKVIEYGAIVLAVVGIYLKIKESGREEVIQQVAIENSKLTTKALQVDQSIINSSDSDVNDKLQQFYRDKQ